MTGWKGLGLVDQSQDERGIRIAGEKCFAKAPAPRAHWRHGSSEPIKHWVWSPNRRCARFPGAFVNPKVDCNGRTDGTQNCAATTCPGQHLADAIAEISLRGRPGHRELSSDHSRSSLGSCSRQQRIKRDPDAAQAILTLYNEISRQLCVFTSITIPL